MKRLIVIIASLLIIIGCESNQNATKKDSSNISKAKNRVILNKNEEQDMVSILKNRDTEKANRLKALYVLEEKKYSDLKNVLEEILPTEETIKYEIIESSFKIKNFKYAKKDRLDVLKYALREKSYDSFINIYTEGDVIIMTEDSFENMKNDIDMKNKKIITLNAELKKLDGELIRLKNHKNQLEKSELLTKEDILVNLIKAKERELDEVLEVENILKEREKEFTDKIESKEKYQIEMSKLIEEAEKNNQNELKNILLENVNIAKKDIEIEKEKLEQYRKTYEETDNKKILIEKKYDILFEKKWNEEKYKVEEKVKEKEEILKNYNEKIDAITLKIEENKNEQLELQTDIEKINNELAKKDEVLILTKDDLDYIINLKNKEKNLMKLLDISIKSDNYYLFKKLSEVDLLFAVTNTIDNKYEWVEELLITNQDKYLFMTDYIGEEEYSKYKPIIYHYYKNGELMKESVDLIIQNEGSDNGKIFDESYFMQFAAIRDYGLSNSKKMLEKELNLNPSFVVYRGLAIVRYEDIYDITKEKYEEVNDPNLLEVMYFIRTESSRNFLINNLIKQHEEFQRDFIKKMNQYNKEDSLRLGYEILNKTAFEKDMEEIKIIYLDFLSEQDVNYFIRGVLKLIENKSLTEKEKQFIIKKLDEFSGEETSGQILKTLEIEEYQRYESLERKSASFSEKLNLWKKYLEIYPNTYYREKIEQRIDIYATKVEELKDSFKFSVEQQTKQIDDKITTYKEMLRDETDISTIYTIEDKIKELEKNKAEIEKEYNLTPRERLVLFQNEYFKYEDETNKLYQHISMLQQTETNSKEIDSYIENMRNAEFKKTSVLEKAILLYGMHLDENNGEIDESFLNKDFLRELKRLNR